MQRLGWRTGFRDGDANGAEKRSESLALAVAMEHLQRRRRGEEREQVSLAPDPTNSTVFLRLLTPMIRPTSRLPLGTQNGTVGA